MHVKDILIKDNEVLEKYNEICNKFSSTIEKVLATEPVYNKIYLKVKQNIMK